MPAKAVRPLSVSDFDFTGPLGSAGATVEQLGPNYFKVTLGAAPRHPEWANMLQFTLHHARGNPLRLDVCFHGGNDNRFNTYFYSWSYDGLDWTPIHWQQGYSLAKDSSRGDTLVFPTFQQDTVLVGHQVPMSCETLTALLQDWSQSPHATRVRLGDSPGGRPIWRLTITGADSPIPPAKRLVHYFAGQHPGENNARWRLVGMIQWLLSDQGKTFRDANVCHFVPLMSPDSPAAGWYRVNSAGVDMNRSYRSRGALQSAQTPEAWIVQKDLEGVAAAGQLTTVWSMHTCLGELFPILHPGPEMGTRLRPWTALRDAIRRYDPEGKLSAPLRTARPDEEGGRSEWAYGPHAQFGVSAFLIEGGGTIFTKAENIESGRVLIKGLADYCLAGAP